MEAWRLRKGFGSLSQGLSSELLWAEKRGGGMTWSVVKEQSDEGGKAINTFMWMTVCFIVCSWIVFISQYHHLSHYTSFALHAYSLTKAMRSKSTVPEVQSTLDYLIKSFHLPNWKKIVKVKLNDFFIFFNQSFWSYTTFRNFF